MSPVPPKRRGWNGLVVVGALVVAGIVTGSAYFQYKAPRLRAEFEKTLADAPTSAAGRLEVWHEFGSAQIHHKLTKLPPRIEGHAWLVTHAVEEPEGDPLLWGIDLDRLPQKLSHLEELKVVIELPTPGPLGHASLAGDGARHVPLYAADQEVPDPDARVRELVIWFLQGLTRALERDIEGSSLEVRLVDGQEAGGGRTGDDPDELRPVGSAGR